MIAIQLPISFHTSRTVPISDLCKNACKTRIDKIYVWNADGSESVQVECTIQRDILEPWVCSDLEVGRTKTKVHANYPIVNDSGWAALTLSLKTPKSLSESPHSMILEIWCL
jgi:hypothetical protein